jgi:biotin--protein ligase
MIAIYEGEGTTLENLRNLDALFLSEHTFFQSNWDHTCTHFILPGGRDRPYHAAFKGAGNRKIRSFVERGGTYVGLCAGAYYGAAHVEFDKDFPLEVCEERELAFFPGKAVGPAFGKGTYVYGSESGARAVKIITPSSMFYAYYNGGCTFVGDLSTCKILARYADLPGQPPAVIECMIGKGKAILSGVHLETPSLEITEAERIQFWDQVVLTDTDL